jgi:hypothetical protein
VVPEFTEQVLQSFAFLETAYGYRLYEHRMNDPEDARDAQASVTYVSERVAVSLTWSLSSVAIGVSFIQLDQPYTMPARVVFVGESHGAARAIELYTLADMLGHADDPDFVLGDGDRVDGRSVSRRFKLVQTDFADVVQRLARATERYARDILQGKTGRFPETMRHYTQKLQAQGIWVPQ